MVLTPAQLKIMACLAEGALPKEVPAKLGLSPSTVHTQLHHICKRLGVENWLQALDIYRPMPTLALKLTQAEILIRAVLLDPKTNNTIAQPRLIDCLDSLSRARQILRALPKG